MSRRYPTICCLHFDEILNELGFWARGQAESWQREATFQWCSRIALLPATHVLLEGQTRHAFTADACAAASVDAWEMVLVHCAPHARVERLLKRGEPDLIHPEMEQWADWLVLDATSKGMPILDTTDQSIESCCTSLAALLELPSELVS